MARRDPLQEIPGVGPSISADLRGLGIERVSDLLGKDPLQLYERQCTIQGGYVDRCVLYVFRCAVYYATEERHDPELLLWWNWKDRTELDGETGARLVGRGVTPPLTRGSGQVQKPTAKPDRKPDRREAFREAAETLDATFLPGKRPSGDEVHLKHGPWQVILDTYTQSNGQSSVTYTRARALYVAKEDFTFRVSRRHLFTRFAEMFGFYGLLVGDQELERKYTIKSTSDPRGRSLMMDRRLRELIMVQPSLRLQIRRLSWTKRRKGVFP